MVERIIIICLLVVMIVIIWYMKKQRAEIYEFAEQLEENLDYVLAGKPMQSIGETQDVLIGRVNQKLRQVERIWKKKEQQSQEDKRMMKELISDISHQIKTPLANQKIYLEILEQESLGEKGVECLCHMERQVDKLTFLFQQMIQMSRLEAGVIEIQKQEADMYKTLEGAIRVILPKAAQKEIDIMVECKPMFLIFHDKKWTEEAIFNILDNAVKYTNTKGTIKISVNKQEVFTVIGIKDSGKGISLSCQAQIFNRFYREPEVHQEEGLGIGLYLVRKVMELQRGYVEVESQVGMGSEFLIYLPNEL